MTAMRTPHRSSCHAGPRALLALAMLLLLPAAAPRPAGDRTAPEYEVKAAILAQFIHYTTWPEDAFDTPEAPLVLAIVGEDPFGEHIEAAVAKRDYHGRSIVVRRYTDPEDIGPCHFLFVSRSLTDRSDEVLARVGAKSVFTVSDSAGFAEQGGTARLFLANGSIKFEINMGAARRSHLQLASGLLKHAKIIEDTDG